MSRGDSTTKSSLFDSVSTWYTIYRYLIKRTLTNMKKILSSVLLLVATTTFVFAQTSTTTAVSSSDVSVSAGLTPENPFYLFDKITESLQELFVFSPDAKVRLQLAFAAERVAEAKVMLSEEGDHSKGLSSVQASIVENIQKTSDVIKAEKAAGKDVTKLAKEANDEFDSEESELSKSLAESHKEIVDIKIEAFKKLLEAAKAAKDAAKISDVERDLLEAKQAAEALKDQKDEIRRSFQTEKREIEEEMSEEDQEEDEVESEDEDADDSDSAETDEESENKIGVRLEIKNEVRATSTLRVDVEVKDSEDQEEGSR